MIGYRYFLGPGLSPSEGADADRILERLSDLLLYENDLGKSLELLKQQGIKGEASRRLQGIHEFLDEVRRLKQNLQGSSSPEAKEELRRLERLEQEMRRASWGLDLEKIDAQEILELLGEESHAHWNHLKAAPRLLEINGYIERLGGKYVLTPKGMRKIGQRALQDVFSSLLRDSLGNHRTALRGNGTNLLIEESRPYRFGDPFHLDLNRTLMNALRRTALAGGGFREGPPFRLQPGDFEVYETDARSRSAIALLLDMSGSMARDEKFFAAKKVALALHTLIQTQFPHDRLVLIGFSSYARELKARDLPSLNWDPDNPYTNMEEGLILAEKLLARERSANKQIILVSDGEPTAHLEDGKVFFQFPPHPKTLAKTIQEFKKCAARGIRLNIFMLSQEANLLQFVRQISRLNRGRAFFSTPRNLGRYLLLDFLGQKRKWIEA